MTMIVRWRTQLPIFKEKGIITDLSFDSHILIIGYLRLHFWGYNAVLNMNRFELNLNYQIHCIRIIFVVTGRLNEISKRNYEKANLDPHHVLSDADSHGSESKKQKGSEQ